MSEELAKPFIEDRSSNKEITRMRHHSTKNAIEDVFGVEFASAPVVEKETVARDSPGSIKVTGSCHLCYRQSIKRRKKTRKSCAKCEKHVCDKHSSAKILCSDCLEQK